MSAFIVFQNIACEYDIMIHIMVLMQFTSNLFLYSHTFKSHFILISKHNILCFKLKHYGIMVLQNCTSEIFPDSKASN